MRSRIKARPAGGTSARAARFEFKAATARDVCIAGSFNDWHPLATPMIRLDDGRWVKELALPPGRHEYLFVVDGQWMPDPAAHDAAPNPFGGWNSVREVQGDAQPTAGPH